MTGSELIAAYADYETRRDSARDGLLLAVRSYALHVTADEEAAQDAMTRVWRYLPKFDPKKGSFAGWVRRIAKTASLRRGGAKVDALVTTSTDDHRDVGVMHEARRVPEKLRVLLRHLTGEDARLLTLALAGDGNLYRAGATLGMTRNQVDHRIRQIKNICRRSRRNPKPVGI